MNYHSTETAPPAGSIQAPATPLATPLSRRRFIQLMGTLTAVALADHLAAPEPTNPLPLIHGDALDRISTSPLLTRTLDRLRQRGFPFDQDHYTLVEHPDHADLMGIMLSDTRNPPYQDGAQVVLTMDLNAPERAGLQWMICHSHADGIAISIGSPTSKNADAEQTLHVPRGRVERLPGLFGSPSRHAVYSDLAAEGEARRSASPWYHMPFQQTAWQSVPRNRKPQLRFTQVSEYRDCRESAANNGSQWYSEVHTFRLLDEARG
ncbi:MAG TPA: hypothetical protein VD886_22150 [Herpetosiphonaceae bacterium]|nr:hypothetical protein [Herpetosiphonaceae bacterium]